MLHSTNDQKVSSRENSDYLSSRVDKAFFGADLCCFPIQHISEFRLKLRKVLLSCYFIWHLGIFPDQPDTHSFWRGIVLKNIAVDCTGQGMLLSFIDFLQLFDQLFLLARAYLHLYRCCNHGTSTMIYSPWRLFLARTPRNMG